MIQTSQLLFSDIEIRVKKREYKKLVIFNGKPGDKITHYYVSSLLDDGTPSMHQQSAVEEHRIITNNFDENGEVSFNWNCGGCEDGRDIYLLVRFEYHGLVTDVTVIFEDQG